jgi:hypothetical protein
MRVDDVELKGFSGSRSVFAFVPGDDPGRAAFEAGRKALDEKMVDEGLAHLSSVESGVLQQAAKVVAARYRSSACGRRNCRRPRLSSCPSNHVNRSALV